MIRQIRFGRVVAGCLVTAQLSFGILVATGSSQQVQPIRPLPTNTSVVHQITALEAANVVPQVTVAVRVLAVDKATRNAIYDGLPFERLSTRRVDLPENDPDASLPIENELGSFNQIVHPSHMTTATLEFEHVRQIFTLLSQDDDSNIVVAPKISLLFGQYAQFNNTAQRPFVTGVDEVVAERRDNRALQPRISIIQEGMTLGVRVDQNDDDTLTIGCRAKVTVLLDAGETTLFGVDSTNQTRIQIPRVHHMQVNATQSLQEGQMLMIDPYVNKTIKREKDTNMPVLSNIPYLNGLGMKHIENYESEQWLIILLEPTVHN